MTAESRRSLVSIDCTLSNDAVKLYNSTSVQNVNEAVTVLFHAFLLESGFVPKDIPDEASYQSMPENWNANKVFTNKYTHCCCPAFTCCVNCVPLNSSVSVHGIVCDVDCHNSVHFTININKYLKQENHFSDVFEVFCNLDELSRSFKDNFCLPLINLVHENGRIPLYGMPGLLDDLKMYILECLPVEDVMSMSAVNKNFNSLANSTSLWKHLFQRDFSNGGLLDTDSTSSETNWKRMYKKEYLKRRPVQRIYRYPTYRVPEIFPVGPNFGFDPDIEIQFNPPFPGALPYFPFGGSSSWWYGY